MQAGPRRFACTACGLCCNRGPELELSEATALAGTFVTSLLFKVHSLPISDRSGWAAEWWRNRESRIPLRPALDEAERHLRQFGRRRIDKQSERQVFLDISAIVDDEGPHCPALTDGRCAIYEARPLSCRTVPLHYSRPASTLQAYVDRFVATPGYRCDTTGAAPTLVEGNKVLDPQIAADRERAVLLARKDRPWKEALLAVMDDPVRAAAASLPTYPAVLNNSDAGYATMVPMIVAWRVARREGLLSASDLIDLCGKQADLIRIRLAQETGPGEDLRRSLAMYEQELATGAGPAPHPATGNRIDPSGSYSSGL